MRLRKTRVAVCGVLGVLRRTLPNLEISPLQPLNMTHLFPNRLDTSSVMLTPESASHARMNSQGKRKMSDSSSPQSASAMPDVMLPDHGTEAQEEEEMMRMVVSPVPYAKKALVGTDALRLRPSNRAIETSAHDDLLLPAVASLVATEGQRGSKDQTEATMQVLVALTSPHLAFWRTGFSRLVATELRMLLASLSSSDFPALCEMVRDSVLASSSATTPLTNPFNAHAAELALCILRFQLSLESNPSLVDLWHSGVEQAFHDTIVNAHDLQHHSAKAYHLVSVYMINHYLASLVVGADVASGASTPPLMPPVVTGLPHPFFPQ
ncbi:hypothetical protein BC830DRAFT_205773 [Chytriomyces sp. MP71]|nr:hypothetical protein BC830DRAFT_205773 [Chytriomyces sp. MP71]